MPDSPDDINDNERKLLIRAAAQFSDACDLPHLTPACPFYEITDAGPSCAEQCRDLIERYPDDLVKPSETSLGTGIGAVKRHRPRRGPEPESKGFDAREYLLVDRGKPLVSWRTPSLLMEFRDSLISPSTPEVGYNGLQLASELHRRGINCDFLFTNGLAIGWAVGIVLKVAMDKAESSERFQQWTELANSYDSGVDDPGQAEFSVSLGSEQDLTVDSGFLTALIAWAAQNPLEEVLTGRVPTLEELSSVSSGIPPKDREAQWMIDRFTQTYLSDWDEKSLIEEWRYIHSSRRACCSPAVMQERRIDPNELAKELAHKSAEPDDKVVDRSLNASQFASIALKALQSGNAADAIGIYRALATLRPGDYEVLNNLGFCLMQQSPREAVAVLERCVKVGEEDSTRLTYLNLSLAQYKVGNAADAKTALRMAQSAPDPDKSGYVWSLDEPSVVQHQSSLLAYALRLADFISSP